VNRLSLLRFLQYCLAALFALAVYLVVVQDLTVAGLVLGAVAVGGGFVVQKKIFDAEQ